MRPRPRPPRRRTLVVAAAALLVAVAGSLAALRLLDVAADPAGVALPAEQAVATRAALSPTVHLFAEPVTARLHVTVDRRRIDPESVRVTWDFAPYEPLGERRLERRDAGHVAHLTYSVALRCLTLECVPPRLASEAGENEGGRGERHAFRFPAAQVRFGDGLEPLPVRWRPLEVVSRINASIYGASLAADPAATGAAGVPFPFAHDLAPAPPTYLVPPRLLAAAALAAALLLLVVPARECVRWARRRRRTPAEAWALLTPRERARLVSAWAAGRDDPAERRRALELAAAELGRGGEELLAARARELAWSGGAPPTEAALELSESLNGRGNGRAR